MPQRRVEPRTSGGCAWEDSDSRARAPLLRSLYETAWNSKRVGVATAATPDGPWRRRDTPVLSPRPGRWDAAITSNPAAAFLADGSTVLLYKSLGIGYPQRNTARPRPLFKLGAARSSTSSARGPYRRMHRGTPLPIPSGPLLASGAAAAAAAAEDPYLWRCAVSGRLHLLFKTMLPIRRADHSVAVPGGGLAYTHTADGGGLGWWAPPRLAFNRTMRVARNAEPGVDDNRRAVDDTRVAEASGTTTTAAGDFQVADRLERPQLIFDADGVPTHAFLAMMRNGSSSSVVLRLAPPPRVVNRRTGRC